jgi:hypothetical protein
MSARRIETTGSTNHHHTLTLEARQTRLCLSRNSVIIHKNGLEFRSTTAFTPWTEVTLTLQSPPDAGKLHCNGVVISCTGNRHTGYHVSLVFTGLSKHAEARLSMMAYSPSGS